MAQPPTISEALKQGVEALQEAGISEPRLDAEVLLRSVLEADRAFLYAHSDDTLAADQWARYRQDLDSRCSGKPTQYITGFQEFFGLLFRVSPDVLIPRPETELLVEQTLTRAAAGARILDIGTGSGAIALAIQNQLPGCQAFGCDISRAALRVALENGRHLAPQVSFVQADLADAFLAGSFDLIACNPPYIPASDLSSMQREVRDHEPGMALLGGEDGLEVYRRLSATASRVLRPGGWLLMEVGYNTSAAVKRLFHGQDWEKSEIFRDLSGWERVVAVRKAAAASEAPEP